ncbi:MAG: hypothetical protein HY897_25835 [Deltaproteobacteria bacterium]|nr:hypothetical protein [Deltaproteobacteria bacterium]
MPVDEPQKPAAAALGSLKLSKAAIPQGAGSGERPAEVVRAADSEIGTEADIGRSEPAESRGGTDDLRLQIENSRPVAGAGGGKVPSDAVEIPGSLPLYKFPGTGELRQEQRAPAGRGPKAKSPSGSHGAAPPPEAGPQPAGQPISARKEHLFDRIAEHKTLLTVAALLALAALLVLSLVKYSERASREAEESERLQKISGQK